MGRGGGGGERKVGLCAWGLAVPEGVRCTLPPALGPRAGNSGSEEQGCEGG